jgi:hypothetical protein
MRQVLRDYFGWGKWAVLLPLVSAAGLAAIFIVVAALHFLGPFLFIGGLGWLLWKGLTQSPEQKAEATRKIEESRRRIYVLIQSHLATHQLPNTPENRLYVLNLLSKPAPRGRRR